MIYRNGCPDFLFFQSKDQIKYFSKNLGWNKKKLILINSLRLKKREKINCQIRYFSPIIYLI